MSEFATVDAVQVDEHLSMLFWVVERWGEVGSAGEVVMVIMTSFGVPTGSVRSLSTESVIFVSGESSTEIMSSKTEVDLSGGRSDRERRMT